MKTPIASINNGRVTVTEIKPSCSEGAAAGMAIASMALCGLPLSPNTEHKFEVKTPSGTSTFKDRSAAIDFASRSASR